MGISNFICIIASRNDAKSFIIALYACCRCILYPGTKFRIGSSTKKQAKLIVSDKILDELCEWSKPLKAEISDWSTSENNIFVKFKNGSKITVFVANDNARGLRSNISACEKVEELNNVASEINSIVNKINSAIVDAKKKAEADAKIAEQNTQKEEKVEVEDIFSEMCELEENKEEEDVNIF